MSQLISSFPIGTIFYQSGKGYPTHIATRGCTYIDIDTAIEYINKDGLVDWVPFSDSSSSIFGNYLPLSGGTVYGPLSATSVSATSYNGYTPLPTQALTGTGVTLFFTTDRVYGTLASPETATGVTANVTGALLGVTNILIHSGATTPTFSSEYKKLSGSGNYTTGQLNYIFATYIAPTEIIYSINQRT